MGKDPATLLYTADFLIGASDLTNEETGIYIKLLCLQHQKGHLSEKSICLFLNLPYEKHMLEHNKNTGETKNKIKLLQNFFSAELLSKFKIDEEEKLYNERFEIESDKRSKYTESRRKNAKKREEKEEKIKKHMLEHMENVNEDVNENKDNNLSIKEEKEKFSKKNDPYINDHKTTFVKTYFEIFGIKPFIGNKDCQDLVDKVVSVPDFMETLSAMLTKMRKINFDQIGYKPSVSWFLKDKNYSDLRNGVYDQKTEQDEGKNGYDY